MEFKCSSGSNVDRISCTMERYFYTLETHKRDKIVNNAIKFTPRKGQIFISASKD